MNKLVKIYSENKGFILFLALMLFFRGAIADWNRVPTGSMKPTIIEGDHIFVNKLAYDIQLPLVYKSLYRLADPKRGEIIIFESAVSDIRLVKRVIGEPGDTVYMHDNRLFINGQAIEYSATNSTDSVTGYIEHLGDKPHHIQTRRWPNRFANFKAQEIPEGFYLVLGDNRDNSHDSRFIGLIPRDEIIGRASRVLLSLNPDNYYLPRSARFWHKLDPEETELAY